MRVADLLKLFKHDLSDNVAAVAMLFG